MKLEQVLPALREGKRIRAKGWRPECHIMRNKDEFIDERGYEFGFMTMGHLDADWEIVAEYREPKRFEAWVNLYSDGTAEIFTNPMRSLTEQRPGIFEHRRITWEVPDNG